ncbi:hypothetical protein [Thauera sp. Sel9]|uniref:hypothetical protein n=1 Tax=Thauera sp. Sel9 TaxID=2974299 RepID=UPI0021E165EC|nr:hypothetical protein [Thauera sp. Sel9]MCV2219233.1 hypothetical protein [Thauera sp. Sel9]
MVKHRLSPVHAQAFDETAPYISGRITAELKKKGRQTGISAHAGANTVEHPLSVG